jgi:hypothetical protein
MLKSLRASLLLLLLLAPLLAPVAGCKEIRKFMPPTTIDNPAEGTREWLVYKTIEASQLKDDKAAWEKLRPLLHSDVIGNTASENSFRTMNFPALRRKVKSFTPDDAKPTYLLAYAEEDAGASDLEFRLFVVNETSDMPSPFRIRRDPAANDDWRVANIP